MVNWYLKKFRKSRRPKRGAVRPPPSPLDRVLFTMPSGDPVTVRDACEHVAVFGQPGCGKTTTVGATVAKAYMRAMFGFLVLTTKVSDASDWLRWAREVGREKDVILFGPGHGHCFNPLEFLLRDGEGDMSMRISKVVHLFGDVGTVLQDGEGGHEDPIWSTWRDVLVHNVVALLVQGGQTVSFKSIDRLMATAPKTETAVNGLEERTEAFLCGDLKSEDLTEFEHAWAAAVANARQGVFHIDRHTREALGSFFLDEYWAIPEKTRGSVEFAVGAVTKHMVHGTMAELFSTETTLTPEVTLEGKILVLDISVKEHEDAGAIGQTIFKHVWQKRMEKRSVAPEEKVRPVALWVDEYQTFATPEDSSFQATARSARAPVVALTQNIAGLRKQLGADATESLLGLFGTKVFMCNSGETNEIAARLISEDWRYSATINGQGEVSFSESLRKIVEPVEFTRLKCGEAIVFRAGEGFRNGTANFLRAKFERGGAGKRGK